MAFYDYREPIEYVVDRYFARKKFYDANISSNEMSSARGEYPDNSLPEIPCRLIRDESGKVSKIIYGDVDLLEGDDECDPLVWREELIRDDNGAVQKITTTYPDGESVTTELVREDGKMTEYKYVVE